MKQRIILLTCTLVSTITFGQFWKTSEPMLVGGNINTDAEESIPVFSPDSSKLYFVRTYDGSNTGGSDDQDIWVSERDANGDYGNCKRLKSLNNKYHNAVLGIGGNGSRMYVLNSYEGKKDLLKGLAVSEYENGDWEKPTEVVIPDLDIEGNYYGFHVNKNEKVIILSYQGPNSKGMEDLYVSVNENGSWSSPIHMGDVINSSGYEISPFLSTSNDTLFFSSNGHGGFGDADIFYSVKQGSWDKWSEPVNLGDNINSSKFDAHFSLSQDQAYWSSNRASQYSDIYMLNILTPPPLDIACTGTNVTTHGGSDGKVDAEIEGGVPPFKFAWSNGETREDIAGVIAGEYTVTVTDAVGQTAQCSSPISEPPAPLIANYEFKHFFGYNENKMKIDQGDLKSFVENVVSEIEKTDRLVKLKITSSASYVPTRTYRNNENLAAKRADNMKAMLNDYFESKNMAGKISIEVINTSVNGPKYARDPENKEKYGPHQFVSVVTE